ncbi:MAG TPA: NAD-dependent epimerase/dehydratase family protein [Gammaproteobacteria bacterium]|nr:NAD-dependent epimerase/dehydratase family protein [Gammaproteobacteria bacterium]
MNSPGAAKVPVRGLGERNVRVLVTGATGFVGRAVCSALLDADHRVTAAVRKLPADIVSGCEPVAVGDIDGETPWLEALDGVDGIVHLAALTHRRGGHDPTVAYRRINVAGSTQLARAAIDADVHSFVYMSSIKVNGESSPVDANGVPRPFSGNDEPRPTTAYGKTKWEAEQALHAITGGTPMRLIVLRPPLVYGPGQKANLLDLMRAVDSGVPLPFAGLGNLRSLIGVENLAAAAVLAVASDRAVAGTYTLADVDLSSADLVRAMAAALGKRVRLFRFPRRLLEVAAWLTGRSDAFEKIAGSLIVENESIAKALSWAPRRSLEQSLAEAAAQYRVNTGDR